MDKSKNKNTSIQISEENFSKLKAILEKLNINIDSNLDGDARNEISKHNLPLKGQGDNILQNMLPEVSVPNIEQETKTKQTKIQDYEDILEPITPEDLDDTFSPDNNGSNEIMPDDIINEDQELGDSRENLDIYNDDLDLASDDDNDNIIDTVKNFFPCHQSSLPDTEHKMVGEADRFRMLTKERYQQIPKKDTFNSVIPVEKSSQNVKSTETMYRHMLNQMPVSSVQNPIDKLDKNYTSKILNDISKIISDHDYLESNKMPKNTIHELTDASDFNHKSLFEEYSPTDTNENKKNEESTNAKQNIKSKIEVLKIEKKITLNIGGKKFNLKKNLLKYLGINYSRLHKIIKDDGRTVYFLDRDPYYFSKIINLIKLYGTEQEKILERIDDYSEQLVSELCLYGLLDKKFNPRPKLRLKRTVTFPSRHDDVVKIIAGDQLFETSSVILSKSNYFDTKLKLSRSKQFYLADVDPKIFRYVLNFLRTGELYINNADIIELLNNYGIEYEKLENKKINENIVSHYVSCSMDSVNNQIINCVNILDPRLNPIPNTNMLYQFMDNKYYYPENMFVSPNVENINIITTDSKLLFGSDIIFNLTDSSKNMGDCIEDLLLCIDIPVLKPTEQCEYIDMIEYLLIEYIGIVYDDGTNKKIILQTNNDLLYIYPIIYTHQANDYHEMTKINDKKMKLFYDNNLIDIYRIILPLFLFNNKQNGLPIKKLINDKKMAQMFVKMAPTKKLFKNKIKDIPLLNIYLVSNFVNLAPTMSFVEDPHNKPQTITQIPINTELKTQPMLYLYEKMHPIIVPIQTTPNPIFDIAFIPLDKFGFIKDFFFTIIEKDDFIANRIDKFSDSLVELEILQINDVIDSQGQPQKTLVPYCKLDSSMLNYYIPLKRLGHKLPNGIYYYSFSSDPKCNQILGGLLGMGYMIRIKVKKMDGVIKFYANEYYKEIF